MCEQDVVVLQPSDLAIYLRQRSHPLGYYESAFEDLSTARHRIIPSDLILRAPSFAALSRRDKLLRDVQLQTRPPFCVGDGAECLKVHKAGRQNQNRLGEGREQRILKKKAHAF